MITALAILTLAAGAAVATLRVVARDGYHRVPTDPTRLP